VDTPLSSEAATDLLKLFKEKKQSSDLQKNDNCSHNYVQSLHSMKNFYTNRNFNFIKLFTKNKELEYKLRFNQDVFSQRHFDTKLPPATEMSSLPIERARSKQRAAILEAV
jgi:hypothetical protein